MIAIFRTKRKTIWMNPLFRVIHMEKGNIGRHMEEMSEVEGWDFQHTFLNYINT
ncbi:MAG: hypothetical protein K8R11_13010 [Methanococcoides sp.]|nr:hypothetical protein [Methanococcoides sp.]